VAELFIALIHYPVLDRRGKIVTSAVTSLDIHDLARSARTYDVRATYIVHPVKELRDFACSVRDRWLEGYGRQFDSLRQEALERVAVVSDLDEAIGSIRGICGASPLIVHTSARNQNGASYRDLRDELEGSGPPFLILFGTGFGLAPAVAERADRMLAPIFGPGEYNHLSVRAAASIILDRLRGR
jgi:hypothetical protein